MRGKDGDDREHTQRMNCKDEVDEEEEEEEEEEAEEVDEEPEGQWVEVFPHGKQTSKFSCMECNRKVSENDTSMKHFHWCDPSEAQKQSASSSSHKKKSKKTKKRETKQKKPQKVKVRKEETPKKPLLADIELNDTVRDWITSVTPESVHQTERRGADTRKKYTNIEKIRIINEVCDGGKPVDVAHKYGINRSLISKWLSKKDVLLDAIQSSEKKCFDTKNRRKNKYEKLYNEIYEKLKVAEGQGTNITYRWIFEISEEAFKVYFPGETSLPQSFVANFTKRFNIQYQKKYKTRAAASPAEADEKLRVRWHSNSRQIPDGEQPPTQAVQQPQQSQQSVRASDVPLSFAMNYGPLAHVQPLQHQSQSQVQPQGQSQQQQQQQQQPPETIQHSAQQSSASHSGIVS